MNLNCTFNNGPKIEIVNGDSDRYLVQLYEYDNGIFHSVTAFELNNFSWLTHYREWFTDWYIKAYKWTDENGLEFVTSHRFNADGKFVKIVLDTDDFVEARIWLNYALEFKNKHNCKLIIKSNFNDRIKQITNDVDGYDGDSDYDLYATYNIGKYNIEESVKLWGDMEYHNGHIKEGKKIYDSFKNPINWKDIPTGQVASDILGLKYKEQYENLESYNFRIEMMKNYSDIKRTSIKNTSEESANEISIHFIEGAFVEITGNNKKEYKIEFINQDTGDILHTANISNNMWTKTSIKYYVNWLINVYENGKLIFEHKYNDENKNVYIALDSNSLGDTLAWFPYVAEYAKVHKCKVICSTFWNNFFEKTYPEIDFVTPGTTVYNLYAQYIIGIFGDGVTETDKNKRDTRNIKLQEVATDILGLEFREIRPEIYIPNENKFKTKSGTIPKGKYVAIAQHGTSQCKYWNNETGWQETVDYLNSLGYKVVSVSKENSELKNIIMKSGEKKDIYETIYQIRNSDFFIGISSGLSWLAWALGVKTIVISGHTKPFYEFEENSIRIHRGHICNGCWHDNVFDKGDWNWCPVNKNTDKMFECTTAIRFQDVKQAIDSVRGASIFKTNCSGNIIDKDLKKDLFKFDWQNDEYVFNNDNSNNVMAYEIFIDNHYDHNKCKVEKGDVVLDFGANIGIFSRYACELGAKKVYSFEPEPINFQCLSLNSKGHNIVPINKAVSNEVGKMGFNVKIASGINTLSNLGTVQYGNEFKEEIQVETTTFRDIIKDNKIDRVNFLKIDIEGAENNVIYSMNKEDFDLVDKIALEYHHVAYNFSEEMRQKFIKYIMSNGFTNFYILHLRGDYANMMYFWKNPAE